MSRREEAKKGSIKKKGSYRKGKWKTGSVIGEITSSGAEAQPTGKLHPISWHKSQFKRVVLQIIYYKRPKIAKV